VPPLGGSKPAEDSEAVLNVAPRAFGAAPPSADCAEAGVTTAALGDAALPLGPVVTPASAPSVPDRARFAADSLAFSMGVN
jgi:hypothetical protein